MFQTQLQRSCAEMLTIEKDRGPFLYAARNWVPLYTTHLPSSGCLESGLARLSFYSLATAGRLQSHEKSMRPSPLCSKNTLVELCSNIPRAVQTTTQLYHASSLLQVLWRSGPVFPALRPSRFELELLLFVSKSRRF